MNVVSIILSILLFILKIIYHFFAIIIDFDIAIFLICIWPFTILFSGLRSGISSAIGAMFRRIGHHFKAMFGMDDDDNDFHPLKGDGTWDMRFSVNK